MSSPINLTKYLKISERLNTQRNHVIIKLKEEKLALEEAQELVTDILQAQEIAQKVSQTIQEQVHSKIAKVVTRCLQAVFNQPFEFFIHFERKRGRTEAKIVFKLGELETDPISEDSGGMIDVACFAARIASIVLSRPHKRRFVVMDEPMKMVERLRSNRVQKMLETISKEMKIQFVIVTHNKRLQAGKVIDLSCL